MPSPRTGVYLTQVCIEDLESVYCRLSNSSSKGNEHKVCSGMYFVSKNGNYNAVGRWIWDSDVVELEEISCGISLREATVEGKSVVVVCDRELHSLDSVWKPLLNGVHLIWWIGFDGDKITVI